MAEYTATKIMHNGCEINLGNDIGGVSGYMCTISIPSGGQQIPWPENATMALISDYGYNSYSCGGLVQITPDYTGRYKGTVCTYACNIQGKICVWGNSCHNISFFGNVTPSSGKVAYLDILVVGGGSSGQGYYPSGSSRSNYPQTGMPGGGGGGVCSIEHMPLYTQGVIPVTVGAGGKNSSGCSQIGNPSCFGNIVACGGQIGSSGYPSSHSQGCCVYCCGCISGGAGGAGGNGGTPVCVGSVNGGKLYCGGNGGKGVCSCITGEMHAYGGGGGGGAGYSTECVSTAFRVYSGTPLGCDGGGDGGHYTSYTSGWVRGGDATYYGGGGGGGRQQGRESSQGDGCQGIVIVRYPTDGSYGIKNTSIGGTVETKTIDGVERRIHTFDEAGSTCCFYPVFK